jgi:4-hydroxy-2-oxoheptanedioate aldolase
MIAGGERCLRERLVAGEPLTGVVLKMPCVALLELAGVAGFQLAVIDAEHGPGDMDALHHHLRAADSVGLPVLVRVPESAPGEILRALDAGAEGIVMPHVASAAAAEAAVSAAHYPPRGRRGLALSTRAGRYGAASVEEHLRRAAARTVVVAQIEDGAAVGETGAIGAVDGVDLLFLGTSDLSASLGYAGQWDHPIVSTAVAGVVEAAGEAGRALCVVANGPHDAQTWRARGAQVVLFVAETLVARQFGEVLRGGQTASTASGAPSAACDRSAAS